MRARAKSTSAAALNLAVRLIRAGEWSSARGALACGNRKAELSAGSGEDQCRGQDTSHRVPQATEPRQRWLLLSQALNMRYVEGGGSAAVCSVRAPGGARGDARWRCAMDGAGTPIENPRCVLFITALTSSTKATTSPMFWYVIMYHLRPIFINFAHGGCVYTSKLYKL